LHRSVNVEQDFDLGRHGIGDPLFQKMEHEFTSMPGMLHRVFARSR
jgi:hypothetical protein